MLSSCSIPLTTSPFTFYTINSITEQKYYLSPYQTSCLLIIHEHFFPKHDDVIFTDLACLPRHFLLSKPHVKLALNDFFSSILGFPDQLVSKGQCCNFLADFTLYLNINQSHSEKLVNQNNEVEVFFCFEFSFIITINCFELLFTTTTQPNLTITQAYEEVISWLKSYKTTTDPKLYSHLIQRLRVLETNYTELIHHSK